MLSNISNVALNICFKIHYYQYLLILKIVHFNCTYNKTIGKNKNASEVMFTIVLSLNKDNSVIIRPVFLFFIFEGSAAEASLQGCESVRYN